MHRTTTAPSPINLITTWLFYIVGFIRDKGTLYFIHQMGFKRYNSRSKIFSNTKMALIKPHLKLISVYTLSSLSLFVLLGRICGLGKKPGTFTCRGVTFFLFQRSFIRLDIFLFFDFSIASALYLRAMRLSTVFVLPSSQPPLSI